MLVTKKQNIQISKQRYAFVEEILKVFPFQISLQECSLEEDKYDCSDFRIVVTCPTINYACRLRNYNGYWKDATFRIRSYTQNKVAEYKYSEYFKIANNQVSWDRYFYGKFDDKTNTIPKWFIFDRKLSSRLFTLDTSGYITKWNNDNTGFIAIPISSFFKAGAVLHSYDKKGILDA